MDHEDSVKAEPSLCRITQSLHSLTLCLSISWKFPAQCLLSSSPLLQGSLLFLLQIVLSHLTVIYLLGGGSVLKRWVSLASLWPSGRVLTFSSQVLPLCLPFKENSALLALVLEFVLCQDEEKGIDRKVAARSELEGLNNEWLRENKKGRSRRKRK